MSWSPYPWVRRWLVNEETLSLSVHPEHPGLARDRDGGWWFWDETGGAACGPYESRSEAELALSEYVALL